MKLLNFRKSLKDIFQVNHEAGILRLFLAAALIFILWSLVALISASFDPFGSKDLHNILGINSDNLAFSLFLDIFDAYFSIFSFSLISLSLLIALVSLDIIAVFNLRIKSLKTIYHSKNYLTFCAFSFPRRKKVLFPDDRFNVTEDTVDGPLKASVKPGYALLVKRNTEYSLVFNACDNLENIEKSLAFRDKIIDCFNINPGSIPFIVNDQILSRSFFVEVAYDYDLPAGKKNIIKYASMLALFDADNFYEIIKSLLMAETEFSLNQYLRNHSESFTYTLQEANDDPSEKKENISKEVRQNNYSQLFNFHKKDFRNGLKRNRRRPIYPKPISAASALLRDHENNSSLSLLDELNKLFEINLQTALKTLFGTVFLKAKISHIQEQGSK